MAIVALASSREDLEERLAQHRRRRDGRRGAQADSRERPQGASARWRCCSRTRSARTSCRRSRADRRSCTRARSATSRTAATASSRRSPALALARHRRHRSRLRLRPRRREVLRHQVPLRRTQSGGGGARRDGARAQDERRRQQEESRRRGPRRAREGAAEPRACTSRTCAQFGVPVIVAINRFTTDTDAELADGGGLRAQASACASRSTRCGRRAARAAKSSRARCSTLLDEGQVGVHAALRREAADQGEDRHHRAQGVRRRRRGL